MQLEQYLDSKLFQGDATSSKEEKITCCYLKKCLSCEHQTAQNNQSNFTLLFIFLPQMYKIEFVSLVPIEFKPELQDSRIPSSLKTLILSSLALTSLLVLNFITSDGKRCCHLATLQKIHVWFGLGILLQFKLNSPILSLLGMKIQFLLGFILISPRRIRKTNTRSATTRLRCKPFDSNLSSDRHILALYTNVTEDECGKSPASKQFSEPSQA